MYSSFAGTRRIGCRLEERGRQIEALTIASSEKATAYAEKEMDDGRKWMIDCKSVFLKTTCEVRENSDGVKRE